MIGRRRIPRVAVPLLFWSAVYILLQTAMVKDYRPLEAVKNLLSTPAEDHLWYLYALIAVYLLLPLLRLLVKHAPRRIILYTLLLWAVFSSLWRAAAGLLPRCGCPATPIWTSLADTPVMCCWAMCSTPPKRRPPRR